MESKVSNNKIDNKSNKNIEKKKKRPMKHRVLFRFVSLAMVVLTCVLLVMLAKMNFLDVKYIAIFTGILVLIEILILFVLNKRFKVVLKVPFLLISLIISGSCIFGIYNLSLAANFVERIVSATVQEERFNIYVLNESEYKTMGDLDTSLLGYFDNGSESLSSALTMLKKQVTFKREDAYDDLERLFTEGIEEKLDAVFISSSLSELLEEEYSDLFNKFRLLDSVTVSIKETTKKTNKDITKDPFLLYVSGIDTYGSIGTVSRSDVNILIAVNPKTGKVLLVNTPRDYYVKLHSKKAMDKLTHAGIYGVEESMNTLADLYATNVDYYLKINFSSLIKIVDALGGITVDSKYSFAYDGYSFKKGQNNLNGKAALAFSRCRKELPGGDVSRGENQEAVIKGIIAKATSPSVITKYTTILKTMEKSFVTNMSEDNIYSFAKFQLNKNPKWEIETSNASGTNSYETTYSAGKTKLYVMMPNEESISEVKRRLDEILEESN